MISENPMMALSGVRSSWLITFRKCDFESDARSANSFGEHESRFGLVRIGGHGPTPR